MKAIETMMGVIAKAPRNNGLKVDQLMMRMSRTFALPIQRLNETLEKTRRTVSKPKPKFQSRRPAQTPSPKQPFDPNLALAQAGEDGEYGGDHAGQYGSMPGNIQPVQPAAMHPILGVDRELFELLIESPDLAATAVESIDPDWLETVAAKMLLSAYQDLDLAGRELTSENVLLLIENEDLKSQFVTLQDRVHAREGKLSASSEERYSGVITRYAKRAADVETSNMIAKLESENLAEEEEATLLKQLFEAEKARHRGNPNGTG
jgi:DNA primase